MTRSEEEEVESEDEGHGSSEERKKKKKKKKDKKSKDKDKKKKKKDEENFAEMYEEELRNYNSDVPPENEEEYNKKKGECGGFAGSIWKYVPLGSTKFHWNLLPWDVSKISGLKGFTGLLP